MGLEENLTVQSGNVVAVMKATGTENILYSDVQDGKENYYI